MCRTLGESLKTIVTYIPVVPQCNLMQLTGDTISNCKYSDSSVGASLTKTRTSVYVDLSLDSDCHCAPVQIPFMPSVPRILQLQLLAETPRAGITMAAPYSPSLWIRNTLLKFGVLVFAFRWMLQTTHSFACIYL